MKIQINKKKLRKLEPTKDAFASLLRSIIYQQISGSAAASIERKFFSLFNPQANKAKAKRGMLLGNKFPTPKEVLSTSDAKLRSAGLSRGKIIYIKDLAAKFLDGTINPKKFSKMSDAEIEKHLVQVKGIGTWTAHMFLIFALNRPDVLPTGDLAIRKGFMKAFGLRKVPSHEKMISLARAHEGERTYLSLHLWGIMDNKD